MRKLAVLAVVLALLTPASKAETYDIDSTHSEIGFRIRHLVGRVPGRFTKFSGTIDFTPGKPETWKVEAAIDPASINTDNEKRDAHLRAPDFFDVANHPAMSFKSAKVTDVKGESAKLHGDLTMRGVAKRVVLDLELGGTTKDPWGNRRAGFSAKGRINRKDFGIVWNKTLDAGGLMLGEEVDVIIEVEALLRPAEGKGKK
ncbi:MAG: polyisoprenoid-binding protein [Elusimicrobia bacterium]|nr:polyisoprenoid-binding protein [Elusimicrobiota bacterium]